MGGNERKDKTDSAGEVDCVVRNHIRDSELQRQGQEQQWELPPQAGLPPRVLCPMG